MDKKNHRMDVDATGFPFFIRKVVGGWTFKKITNNKTKFTIELKMQTIPIIGSVMGIFMKPKLQKALETTARDYKLGNKFK